MYQYSLPALLKFLLVLLSHWEMYILLSELFVIIRGM